MSGQTVRDVMLTNSSTHVRLWCDDDGVWVALPESGPYPGPDDVGIEIDQLPAAEGATPEEALATLLNSPSRLPLEVPPC
ncbi:hypothetical protein [Deinococcus humi]|uniref:Uncharacterized protein n=1 Tax=Deinococcus humi TaxID=662880 RepID=A0A7W8NEV5_9DEIO|nr:hypothetical protein [Deinococcus humi]MBB5363060.1 hypothetical protein [Deinococcus humi]GGO24908.1 hypothetical protein GCM10008949_14250 [Deinococcus humi]